MQIYKYILLDLTFGREFQKLYIRTIKYSVCEMTDPVAEINVVGVFVEHQMDGKMPVAENEIIEIPGFEDFLRKNGQPFVIQTPERSYFAFVKPAFHRPGGAQPKRKIRMEPRKQPLRGLAYKQAFE